MDILIKVKRGIDFDMPRDIEANPFTYRSQLEHEWALEFAKRGLDMVYEPRYYGNWLPDFENVERGILFEIKPTVPIAAEEIPKIRDGIMASLLEKKRVILLTGSPSHYRCFSAQDSLSWATGKEGAFRMGDFLSKPDFVLMDFGIINRIEFKERALHHRETMIDELKRHIQEMCNIVPSCQSCNSRKNTRNAEYFKEIIKLVS